MNDCGIARWGEANLDWLIQTGNGNKPVTDTRFKCRDGGEIVEKQVRPPVLEIGGAVAYMTCRFTSKTEAKCLFLAAISGVRQEFSATEWHQAALSGGRDIVFEHCRTQAVALINDSTG